MYTLLTFDQGFGMPSHSPFCTKAQILLDIAGVAWRPQIVANPGKMPLGRLPVLKTADQLIPDTAHIQAYLEGQGANFFAGCDAASLSHGHMLVRLAEESLRLGMVHDRWLNDACWAITAPFFFKDVPGPLRAVISNSARKSVRKGLTAHGIAQFNEADRVARLAKDLDAFETQIGDALWMLGRGPTAVDAAVLPVLHGIAELPADTPLRREMRARSCLMAYVSRAGDALYSRPIAAMAAE